MARSRGAGSAGASAPPGCSAISIAGARPTASPPDDATALPVEECAEEPLGGLGVAPALNEDVEDVAVLVDGPPHILPTGVDRQEHLVEMPLIGRPFPAAGQPAGVFRPELGTPQPDRLVGDDHTADQHELLDLASPSRLQSASRLGPQHPLLVHVADNLAWSRGGPSAGAR